MDKEKFYFKKGKKEKNSSTPNPKHKISKKNFLRNLIRDKAVGSSKTSREKRKRKRDQLVQSGVRVEIEQRKKKKRRKEKRRKNDATREGRGGRLNGIPRGKALILLLSRF